MGGILGNIFGGGGRQQRLLMITQAQEAERQREEQNRIAEQQRQEARQLEETRQHNIKTGVSSIDNAFGQFDDSYFGGMKQRYVDAYNPKIDQESAKARDQLVAYLAGNGLLESSVGADKLAELEQRTQDARGTVGGQATDFANDFRNKLDQSKTKLYQMAQSATDPTGLAARATGEATSLAQSGLALPQQTNSIGDIFSSFLEPLSYAITSASNAPRIATRGGVRGSGAPISGSGSSQVVG